MSTAEYVSGITRMANEISDENVLSFIHEYLTNFSKASSQEDLAQLSDAQKAAIDEGFESIESDGGTLFSDFMDEVDMKYPQLKSS